jgi:heat shock protein HtpX
MWEQIRSNQIRSWILVSVLGVFLLLLGYLLGIAFAGDGIPGIIIALIVWGFMNLIAYFQGDSILLGISGAHKIKREDHPQLYNVVEEMKIASGLTKMPDIYIIDDPALNAFATGRSPDKASVAITSGLLQKLNRSELQGVIAHELGHIKNRDVLLMSMAGVLLGTIVILAWYGSRMLIFGGGGRSSRRSSSGGGGGGQVIILVVALVFMVLAPIAAQLLYYAVSRKREYLADASSALYTRYPEGLASALEKIATLGANVKSANQATAPMYIINPLQKSRSLSDLTSTHPPIADRIKILRAMAGAGYADYERAYKTLHKAGVMPASAIALVGAVPLASAPTVGSVEPTELDRARQTSQVLWAQSGYLTVNCPCGTKLRVPPEYNEDEVKCPHCGRIHSLKS